MGWLLAVSVLWSFSFGLFGNYLAGLNPHLTACLRLALALGVFLPFLRVRGFGLRQALALAGLGAVQFGLMYGLLNAAYQYLSPALIALYTVLTPLYVALLRDVGRRRFHPRTLLFALLAVGAALLARAGEETSWRLAWRGFLLMQGSNLCFAFGQVAYRRWRKANPQAREHGLFALLYAGAVAVTLLTTTLSGGWADLAVLRAEQVWVLLYLGVAASGLGLFFWNFGVARARAATVAVLNNVKIPLAIAVSLILTRSEPSWQLLVATVFLAGIILLAEKHPGEAPRR